MAKHTDSNIDIDARTWAQLMALSVSDGTYSDIFEQAKTDEGATVPASLVTSRVGAIYGNKLGVMLEQLWTKARAAGGAQTVYELDFTAEASSGALSDGTVAIDGNNWTLVNSANCSTCQITNGAGLQMTHSAGTSTDLDNGADAGSTGTYMHIPLTTLASECSRHGSRMRIWAYFSAYDVPALHNQISVGVAMASGGGYSATTWSAILHNGSTQDGPGIKYGGLEQVGVQSTTSDNVIVVEFPSDGIHYAYGGAWSSGWPSFDALVLAGRNIVSGVTHSGVMRSPPAALAIGVATNSTSGAPSFTLARLKIEIG